MRVLVINCGSSSLKYQVYDAARQEEIARGAVANIGQADSRLKHQTRQSRLEKAVPAPSYSHALQLVLEILVDREYGVIRDRADITAVGHRVVHGGDAFIQPTVITEEVVRKIAEYIPLAPLHNPANLAGIREAKRLFPDVPHVAVFDTAFHQTMPPRAYLYALPYSYYQTHGLRRYGFHGISCRYVTLRAAQILGIPAEALKMVICHLGNGITVAAVRGGESVDTSLGFTPIPGVMMGTRSGDVDPGLILYLGRELGLTLDQIDDLLNRQSGLLGISGLSNDLRVIMEGARGGNERCRLALQMFTYQVKKYIGAYAAAMNGLDALVFTAGIGENAPPIREEICAGLEFLGVELDSSTNAQTLGKENLISRPTSRVKVLVIPTNEELMIAWETVELVRTGGFRIIAVKPSTRCN